MYGEKFVLKWSKQIAESLHALIAKQSVFMYRFVCLSAYTVYLQCLRWHDVCQCSTDKIAFGAMKHPQLFNWDFKLKPQSHIINWSTILRMIFINFPQWSTACFRNPGFKNMLENPWMPIFNIYETMLNSKKPGETMAFSHVFGGTWGNPWPHSHGITRGFPQVWTLGAKAGESWEPSRWAFATPGCDQVVWSDYGCVYYPLVMTNI